jgi:hypothetical protein
MRSSIFQLLCIAAVPFSDAFASFRFTHTSTTVPIPSSKRNMIGPMETTDIILADKDYGEAVKTVAIALTLGGGLIPALIGANKAMVKTLAGKKDAEEEEAPKNIKPGESFLPTLMETKYRRYVEDSGATGPELPFASVLFASERVPLADIVAILGRIGDVNTLAYWRNLPSTKMPNVSLTAPPMWLPRRAFKVNVRKAKFLGWPNDPKTGLPVGGQELKAAEMARISKKDALIGDSALDAVFDSWAWGASVATPDKVGNTLNIFKPNPSEVDLGAFVSAAIRGRSTTGLVALTFIVIQLVVFGALFVGPALRMFFDIDIAFGSIGSK